MALASTSWKPGHSGNPNTPTIPPEVWALFIDYLMNAHTVTWAVQQLHINYDTAYDHRSRDPAFALAWDHARTVARADWYEERLRGRASGEEKGDTLSDIIGLKMTGRFVEQPRNGQVTVNVHVGDNNRLEQRYTAEELELMLEAVRERKQLTGAVVDGEVVDKREVPTDVLDGDEKAAFASPSDAGEPSQL